MDRPSRLPAAAFLLCPGMAIAEPGASAWHMPFLWTFAMVCSAGLAWVFAKWIARLADVRSRRYFWGIATAFFVTFAIFIAPFIVVFGSILVSGKTM